MSGEGNANNNMTIWSAGLGYRDERVSIELGYALAKWDQVYFLYGSNQSDMENSKGRLSMTVGFRF